MADGLGRPHLRERVDRGVADLDRTRPDARYLAIRREGDGGDGTCEITVAAVTREGRREPDQSAQTGGVLLVHDIGRSRVERQRTQSSDGAALGDARKPAAERR